MRYRFSKSLIVEIFFLLFFFYLSALYALSESEALLKLGIDRIDEYLHIFKNKRVGLITNATGYNSEGISTIDILKEKVKLTVLFSPEHGIKSNYKEGALVENTKDSQSNLPIYSLYGRQKKPTKEMLKDIDIVCFDIQDVGSRFYTYIYTMAYAMQACKEEDKMFVVFDRPNPISGNAVEGFILKDEFSSFVGLYSIAQRHGMTVGELALMFNSEFGIACKLLVVPLKNWKRYMYFEELPLIWHPSSPNIPTVETALLYSGLCLFEGCNISVGRGTTMPFRYIGAPFIDATVLSKKLNEENLKGVQFFPCSFIPSASVYKEENCEGVYIAVKNKQAFAPVKTAIIIFKCLKELYPTKFKINDVALKRCGLNLLFGNDVLAKEKVNYKKLLDDMEVERKRFIKKRKPYLLYS